MTNKLQAIQIQKHNLYTYNELDNTRKSNIVFGTLSFYTYRRTIRVLLDTCKRLKAIEGRDSLLLPFIFIKKRMV